MLPDNQIGPFRRRLKQKMRDMCREQKKHIASKHNQLHLIYLSRHLPLRCNRLPPQTRLSSLSPHHHRHLFHVLQRLHKPFLCGQKPSSPPSSSTISPRTEDLKSTALQPQKQEPIVEQEPVIQQEPLSEEDYEEELNNLEGYLRGTRPEDLDLNTENYNAILENPDLMRVYLKADHKGVFSKQDEKTGNTALHFLLSQKQTEDNDASIQLLIQKFDKKELSIKNKKGETALDIATKLKHNDIVAAILKKLQ